MIAAAFGLAPSFSPAGDGSIIVQSTTSTANAGLYDHLLPLFHRATGIRAHVVAVGTGQAIRNARACDGDVLVVHARAAEDAFVADGYAKARHDLMYNDFIIVGPVADPAGVARMADATDALARIAESDATFASRGDLSGTHSREKALWAASGIDPTGSSGRWYREMGSGMGATLNAAIGMEAYTLTDRASWVAFGNKADFVVHVEGDPALLNQYGVLAVSPSACPSANVEDGATFVDWLLSFQGQAAIAAFRVDGVQLFFPNAKGGS
ncbi:MAG: substrate-binding domain-containing protein [Pseudomonadota bacterium]